MGSNFKNFKCELTGYEITYLINENVAEIYNIKFDYKYMKPFCVILRNSLDVLISEKIEKIRQYVTLEDWLSFKDGTNWIVKHESMGNILLECDIYDYIANFLVGIGLSLDD